MDEQEEILAEFERIGAFRDGFISEDEIRQVKRKFGSRVVDMFVNDWRNAAEAYGKIDDALTSATIYVAKGTGKLAGHAAKATGNAALELGKSAARELWNNLKNGSKR